MLSSADRSKQYEKVGRSGGHGWITTVLAAIAIVVSGAAVACSDSPVGPDTPSVDIATEKRGFGPLTAATIGAYHNAFLDFSFPRVRQALAEGGGEQGACRAIAQAMREFIVANRIDADPRDVRDDLGGGRCRASGRGNPAFSLSTDGSPSPEFEAVVNEMAYAVEIGLSTAELSPMFEQKVAYARANLDPAEADVIAAAASVGLSSVDYWNANYEIQLEELRAAMDQEAYARIPAQGSMNLALRKALVVPDARLFSWKLAAARVAVADLKGAVHGGISGIRGGWQGILAGAAIEGGGKSAGALIAELIK